MFMLDVFNSPIAAATLRSRSSSRFLSSKARGKAAVRQQQGQGGSSRQLRFFHASGYPIGFTTLPCKIQEWALGKAGSLLVLPKNWEGKRDSRFLQQHWVEGFQG